MPVRINLKELFPADSQEITIDKVNFNFNKLLELGIGEQGLQGLSGIQGAAGPIGIQGLEGVRGATWYLDTAADPNTLTLPDLLPGDLYLNTVTFSVWQYDGTQWSFVFDLTSIINNYLASSPLPFVRGFGLGSLNDDRFIVFARRGETTADITDDVTLGALGNPANNDTLFLTNFNEDKLNDPLIWSGFPNAPSNNGPVAIPTPQDTEYFFNSLLAVYVDHQTPLSQINGRSHIELGSLYNDPLTGLKLTTAFENLKIRFFKTDITGTGPASNTSTTDYNTAQFTLDPPTAAPSSYRTNNSIFEFCAPKYNNGVTNKISMYLGSRYGLDQITGAANSINADGSLYVQGGSFAGIGLASSFRIGTSASGYAFPSNTGYVLDSPSNSYLMLETYGLTDGIYLNDTTLQNKGNIIQLGMSVPSLKPLSTTSNSTPQSFKGHAGIFNRGNEVYIVSGDPDVSDLTTNYGYFERYNIENPNHPIAQWSNLYGKFKGYTEKSGLPPACTLTSYYGKIEPVGTGVADVVIAGDYMYTAHTQNIDDTINQNAVLPYYERTYFQVLKINSTKVNTFGLERVSRLGTNAKTGSSSGGANPDEITSAYRIKLKGNYAIVATNSLHAPSASFAAPSGYTGGITAINITDPTNPIIEANVASKLLDGSSATTYDYAAILDMTIVGDTLYTLTLQVKTSNQKVRVFMEAYDLSGLTGTSPTITWLGESTNILSTTAATFASILKRGAIAANDKYIYVTYGDAVKVISLSTTAPKTNTPYCKNQYIVRQTLQLTYPSAVVFKQALDVKQYGNSLYVLAEGYLTDPPAAGDVTTYIFKVDVSVNSATNANVPALTQIYSTPLPTGDISSYFYSRFEIIGKQIYVVTHDQSSNYGLTTLDIDGIYTGTAHIESLRSEQVNIGQSLSVGGDTILNSSLNVGGSTLIGGNLGVSNVLEVGGDSLLHGNLEVDLDTALHGNLEVDEDVLVHGDTELEQNLLVGGSVSVGGQVNALGTLLVGAGSENTPISRIITGTIRPHLDGSSCDILSGIGFTATMISSGADAGFEVTFDSTFPNVNYILFAQETGSGVTNPTESSSVSAGSSSESLMVQVTNRTASSFIVTLWGYGSGTLVVSFIAIGV